MLCNVCHKNEASVHLTEIINDKVMKLNLCEECAMKKSAEMEEHFGLGELLAGLTEFGESVKPPEGAVKVKCPNCGLTYPDFKRRGRLGCSECYAAFESKLTALLSRIHGSGRHVGRAPTGAPKAKTPVDIPVRKAPPKIPKPKPAPSMSKLQELQLKLRRAVEFEEFEKAAELRDKIRELEKKEKKRKIK